MSERISASKFGLAVHCVYPWHSGHVWETKSSWASRLGTVTHAAVDARDADVIRTNPDLTHRQKEIALSMYRQYVRWEDANPGSGMALHEIAGWYHPLTGEAGFLSPKFHRDYSGAPDGAFTATVDMLYRNFRLDAVDLKTGWLPVPPGESWQMKLISVIVAKMFDKPEVKVGILSLREHEARLFPATFTDITLDLTRSEAKRVYLALQSKQGPRAGDHCKQCPIKKTCGASTCATTSKTKTRSKPSTNA